MSQSQHAKQEHGSMSSYVIGFILSLVFTLIPYFFVVNHTFIGTTLQVVILGFAVLQMIIQITFFLHLGRGPKPNYNLFFFISTASIIIFIITASILIMSHLHYNMLPDDQSKKLINGEAIYQVGGVETGACQGTKDNHRVVVTDGNAIPVFTNASRCDTLTFLNEGDKQVVVIFGEYPNKNAYTGEDEFTISKNYSKTITLSEAGSFSFYTDLTTAITNSFIVNP